MAAIRQRLKSRNGCQRCKSRRKKCDERRPTCRACERLNLFCTYNGERISSQPVPAEVPVPRVLVQSLVLQEPGLRRDYTTDLNNVLQYHMQNSTRMFQDIYRASVGFVTRPAPPLLFATCALVLTVLMPEDWVNRTLLIQQLSSEAMREIRSVVMQPAIPAILNLGLMCTKFLYFCDAQQYPEPSRRWWHMYGFALLLNKRLSVPFGPPLNGRLLGSYINHLVCSGIFNRNLISDGLTPPHLDYLIGLAANETNGPTDLATHSFYGIPSLCVSAIFRLAIMRRDILQQNLSDSTIIFARESNELLQRVCLSTAGLERVVEILHLQACFLIQQILFAAIRADNPDIDLAPGNQSAYSEADLGMALTSACSRSLALYILNWPLLVLGLASEDDLMRAQIRQRFQNTVDIDRVGSARAMLRILDQSWADNAGLSVLLTAGFEGSIMF